jgi:hypothetical protein
MGETRPPGAGPRGHRSRVRSDGHHAGYQVLIFAERLALPSLAVDRIPRTRVFWSVWCASALSLLLILYVPAAAQMFRIAPPSGVQLFGAVLLGVLAVGWRLLLRRR